MSDGGQKSTLQSQTSSLLKECHSLMDCVRSNMIGEVPKDTVTESPIIANPIDDCVRMIEESRKVIEEIRVLLVGQVFEKLR